MAKSFEKHKASPNVEEDDNEPQSSKQPISVKKGKGKKHGLEELNRSERKVRRL